MAYNILKAGGTSVGTPSAIEIIIGEAFRIHDEELKIDGDSVTLLDVSATGKQKDGEIRDKTTDLLEKILRGENVNEYVGEIRRREERTVQHFRLPKNFNERNFQLLGKYLGEKGVSDDERYSKVVTIVGESLKARQIAAVINLLRKGGAVFVDYDKTGFTTTGGFRNAVKTTGTYDNIRRALSRPEYRGKILVVPGFTGIDEATKKITTLERGGSDTHAVGIACALGAKCAYIYSDTSLRRADPNIVSDAEVIERVTYGEMGEFIGFGSQLLAQRANDAAEQALVELYLRNTFNLKDLTIVGSKISNGRGGVKGIAAAPSLVLALSGLPEGAGALHEVTGILTKYGVGFVNEAGDNRSSSMVVYGSPENPIEINIGYVIKEIDALGYRVALYPGRTRIGLVGEEIGATAKGLVAIGQTLDALQLPLNSTSLPVDGRALSIITDKTHVPNVVRGLYDRLFR